MSFKWQSFTIFDITTTGIYCGLNISVKYKLKEA